MSRSSLQAPVIHGMAQIQPDLRLHYAVAGEGPRTAVLLHGFPQTGWAWRGVMPLLAESGWRVIAPDYRGAGHSSRPTGGYDKRTMAGDLRKLLTEHLKIDEPVAMIGHDIGLMVAFAYAQAWREATSHLVVMDAPLPGTAVFDRLRADPRIWQFAFHSVRDIPEMLVAGRERAYLQAFFDARVYDPSAIGEADLDRYASAYSAAGALRAGFELYRTFDQDIGDAREALRDGGKLTLPVLAVWGALSNTGQGVEEMMREVAEDVRGLEIPASGH